MLDSRTASGATRASVCDAARPRRPADAPRAPRSGRPRCTTLIRELYPLCRSITGDGVRETLQILGRWLPLRSARGRHRARRCSTGRCRRSGTCARPGSRTRAARRVVDFRDSNLHVVGYSVPVRARLPLASCARTCTRCPDRPDWIPYRTSFYREDWGFCLAQRHARCAARRRPTRCCIDSTLARRQPDATARLLLPGESSREVLLSRHVCHPSLANDNLSGLALARAARPLPRGGPAPLLVPVPVRARDDRRDHLARAQRGGARAHPARPGRDAASATPARRPTSRAGAGDAAIDRAFAHVLRHAGAARDRSTSRPTATTSGSSARRASTCRSAA